MALSSLSPTESRKSCQGIIMNRFPKTMYCLLIQFLLFSLIFRLHGIPPLLNEYTRIREPLYSFFPCIQNSNQSVNRNGNHFQVALFTLLIRHFQNRGVFISSKNRSLETLPEGCSVRYIHGSNEKTFMLLIHEHALHIVKVSSSSSSLLFLLLLSPLPTDIIVGFSIFK